MYKFAKVKLPYWDKGYWRLVVDSFESLTAFWDIKAGVVAETYMMSKTKTDPKEMTPAENLFHLFINDYDENPDNKRRRLGMTDDIMIISDRVAEGYNKALLKSGGFYVNMSGGFFPFDNDVEVLETIESEKYSFPDDEDSFEDYKKLIRIISWAGGKHHYAKIGDIDIVWEKEQKWNTEKEARTNAELYIKEYLIKKN